jgi:hypothetical protein
LKVSVPKYGLAKIHFYFLKTLDERTVGHVIFSGDITEECGICIKIYHAKSLVLGIVLHMYGVSS